MIDMPYLWFKIFSHIVYSTTELVINLHNIEETIDETESSMKELKTYLYAKFGSAINLEQE